MPTTLIFSFVLYALISGITPGPANLCSLSASLRFGRKTALRQWTGLFTGYAIVSFASAFLSYFVGSLLEQYLVYMAYVGAIYLVYLAYKMIKSTLVMNQDKGAECSFLTGLMVNLTNVKIMIFCLTVFSIYVLPYNTSLLSLILMAVILPFTGPICNLVWLFLGDLLRRFFYRWQKQINVVMALLLLLCAIMLII